MTTAKITSMEVIEEEEGLFETNTWIYDDQDIKRPENEITDDNWRDMLQITLNNVRCENQFNSGIKPLLFNGPCKIRMENLGDTAYSLPLTATICSRLICEHGSLLPLSNKSDFCGTKIINTAWQIDGNWITMPLPISAAIRSTTLEQLHLDTPDVARHFTMHLEKLVMFGSCPYPKTYKLENDSHFPLATVLVFLPSRYTGGTYRFTHIDDDDGIYRQVFDQPQSDNTTAFSLVLPFGGEHEISSIQSGYKVLLVYQLVSNINSIQRLYSLLFNSSDRLLTTENAFLCRRFIRILTYWQNHIDRMPNKLILPLQDPFTDDPYSSLLFRDKYRLILQLIHRALEHKSSSFLAYTAILQHDETLDKFVESKFLVQNLIPLSTAHQFMLHFDPQHERTVLLDEFIKEPRVFFERFNRSGVHLHSGTVMYRSNGKFHVLILIPYKYQWDLLLDDISLANHHLDYMLSLPHHFSSFCLDLFHCILQCRTFPVISSFSHLIEQLILLRQHIGHSPILIQLAKDLLKHKQLIDQLFSDTNLPDRFVQLANCLGGWPTIATEFFDVFRRAFLSSVVKKMDDVVGFLLRLNDRLIRAWLINYLLKLILKPGMLARHILLSTLCALLRLFLVDGAYSIESTLTLAASILERVRKIFPENEIIDQCLKIHLIPMLVNIYRENRQQNSPVVLMSPAFVLIYHFCFNKLNHHCSAPVSRSSSSIISYNEGLMICPCPSCIKVHDFLRDPKSSTLHFDLSSTTTFNHCLRYTLDKFPMLTLEYQHDASIGRDQTLIISKNDHGEEEQKELCFHLRRLLVELFER